MDRGPKLGHIIADGDAGRDAIHIAVAPVTAATRLFAGYHVGFVDEGDTEMVGQKADPIGIVDPFLMRAVEKGQRFWLFLYPGTITGLAHVWTHSAFPPAAPPAVDPSSPAVESARARLVALSEEGKGDSDWIGYDELMRLATESAGSGHYSFDCGSDERMQDLLNADPGSFWRDWSIVTGEALPPGFDGGGYFSCSC